MAILGIAPGATGQFNELPLPPGSAFPAGTQFSWSTDDTANTALTPSTDGTSAAVAVAPTLQNNATSFNLSVVAVFNAPDGSGPVRLSKTVNVPFNIPAPPVPTDIDITQTS